MDLQFIYDDSTSPPTQSVLQYKVDPDTVYISTDTQQMMVDLNITVFNPTPATVSCQSFQFGIYVGTTESVQLASTSDSVQLTTDQNQWSTNSAAARAADLYWYTANPASGVASEPLTSLASFTFHLMSIPINDIEGATQFMILEMTGSDPNNPNSVQGPLSLTKAQGGLEIVPQSFTVTPGSISPHTEVNLSWDVVGSDHWLVRDLTRDRTIYDSVDDPPAQMQCQDLPIETTTYKLIAYAGQTFTAALADVEVTNPRFLDDFPPAANPPSVDSGTASTISWKTADAQYVIVTASGYASAQITPNASGSGQLQVNPVLTTTYTVTTYGADGKSGEAIPLTVSVNPPQINSFTATPQSFHGGEPVTLTWQTESATALTLNPGGASVPLNTSGYVVNPKGQVVYELTAAGQGPSAEKPITVTQVLESFPVLSPNALAYDGKYIWVACDDAVVRLLATDGSNKGSFRAGRDTSALTSDGTYIWVANVDEGAVTRVLAADGSYQGTFQCGVAPGDIVFDGTYLWVADSSQNTVIQALPLNGSQVFSIVNTVPVGQNPFALVFDGTYIWVANGEDKTMTRLRAADASNQGTFPAGNGGLVVARELDGTYIWFTNQSNNTVTQLLAANGGISGTFPVGNNPTVLAFDGTYIWVANGDGTVTILRAEDGNNIGTVPNVNGIAMIYDQIHIWVVTSDGGLLRILPSDWLPSGD